MRIIPKPPPPPPITWIHGNIVFHEASSWCQKGWGSLIHGICHRLSCAPILVMCWSPDPQDFRMWLFGQMDFKDAVKENEVISVVPREVGLMFLFEEESWTLVCIHTERRACEDTGKRQPPASPAVNLRRNQPYRHLELRLLAAGNVNPHISVL